jgi:hypothetical protein
MSVIMLASCSHSDNDEPSNPASRTVLVYIMGYNSLSNLTKSDLDEMIAGMKGLDTDKNNLIVYYSTYGTTPKLFKINSDGTKDTLKTYSNQISTDETVMKSVFADVISAYPAQSYGLVLWSHGLGWAPGYSSSRTKLEYAGIDESSGTNYLNIDALANVLSNTGVHFDYILFDECYMSNIETYYDLRSYTDYFIASPIEIPGPGAYYTDIVPAMFASSSSTIPANNAEKVADAYYEYYANKYDPDNQQNHNYNSNWIAGTSIALVKSSAIENLASATNTIISKYIQDKPVINISNIFCYDKTYLNYFYDLANFIKQYATDSEYTTWKAAFDNCVVKYNTTATNYCKYSETAGGPLYISMTGTNGLSAYIPSSFYSKLSMNTYFKITGWYAAAGWSGTGW